MSTVLVFMSLLLALPFFPMSYVDGYIAGCGWSIRIIKTAQSDMQSARTIPALPRAPMIDVTNIVSKLRITGIHKEPNDRYFVYSYSMRLEIGCKDQTFAETIMWQSMLIRTQVIVTVCINSFSYKLSNICYQFEGAVFDPRVQGCQLSSTSSCTPYWMVPLVIKDDVIIHCTIGTWGSGPQIPNKSFTVRLRGSLSKNLTPIPPSPSDARLYRVFRAFSYVAMQCVTKILGPFGTDSRFLMSSNQFRNASTISLIYFDSYLSEEQRDEWPFSPACDCDFGAISVINLPGRYVFATQIGLLLVVGVRRENRTAGTERLIENTCIKKMIMHSGVEISRIVLFGGCQDEGKVFLGVTTSKPVDSLTITKLFDSIAEIPCVALTGRPCTAILDAVRGEASEIRVFLVKQTSTLYLMLAQNLTDNVWSLRQVFDGKKYLPLKAFTLSGIRTLMFAANHFFLVGSVFIHSADYGRTVHVIQVPYGATVNLMTSSNIGLWMALHVVNPTTAEHEVWVTIVGFPERIRKIFPDPLLSTVLSAMNLEIPPRNPFIISMFLNTYSDLSLLTHDGNEIRSYIIPVEELLMHKNLVGILQPLNDSSPCPYSSLVIERPSGVYATQALNYLFYAPRMSENTSFSLNQFYVYQSIVSRLIDPYLSYFRDPWKYTNYIFDNVASWRKSLMKYQAWGKYLFENHKYADYDVYVDFNNFYREYEQTPSQAQSQLPPYIYLDHEDSYTFTIIVTLETTTNASTYGMRIDVSDTDIISVSVDKTVTVSKKASSLSGGGGGSSAGGGGGVRNSTGGTGVPGRRSKIMVVNFEVTLTNVGAIKMQNEPGSDLQPVGVDIFLDGAVMNCYKALSSAPLDDSSESTQIEMSDSDDMLVHNEQGFYRLSILSGCKPSRVILFDWKASLNRIIDFGLYPYDCYDATDMPCFNFPQVFYPFFLVVDLASNYSETYNDLYSLRVIAVTDSPTEKPTLFTQEEIDMYNRLDLVAQLGTIWKPQNETLRLENGWPIYSPQYNNNAIVWSCFSWSPCAGILPKFPASPELYMLVEFTNAFDPPLKDLGTLCNFTTQFWVRVQGLPYDMLRYGLPTLLISLIVILIVCLLFYLCMRRENAMYSAFIRPFNNAYQKVWTFLQRRLNI